MAPSDKFALFRRSGLHRLVLLILACWMFSLVQCRSIKLVNIRPRSGQGIVLEPKNGDEHTIGDKFRVTWTTIDEAQSAAVQLQRNNSGKIELIFDHVMTVPDDIDGLAVWTITPQTEPGLYRMRVEWFTAEGASMGARWSGQFTILSAPGSQTSTSASSTFSTSTTSSATSGSSTSVTDDLSPTANTPDSSSSNPDPTNSSLPVDDESPVISSSVPAGIIAGAVLGGLAVFAIIGFGIYWMALKNRRKNGETGNAEAFSPDYPAADYPSDTVSSWASTATYAQDPNDAPDPVPGSGYLPPRRK